MADVANLAPIILKWESRMFVNDPIDPGGATKDGITLDTWRHLGYDKNHDGVIDVNDVKLIDDADFQAILKKGYWDRWQADLIKSQAIANITVDWVWASGIWGIRIPQRLLGLKEDGVVGPKTIEAVNAADQALFFNKVKFARLKFVDDCVSHSVDVYTAAQLAAGKPTPTHEELVKKTSLRFRQGWINRISDFVLS